MCEGICIRFFNKYITHFALLLLCFILGSALVEQYGIWRTVDGEDEEGVVEVVGVGLAADAVGLAKVLLLR